MSLVIPTCRLLAMWGSLMRGTYGRRPFRSTRSGLPVFCGCHTPVFGALHRPTHVKLRLAERRGHIQALLLRDYYRQHGDDVGIYCAGWWLSRTGGPISVGSLRFPNTQHGLVGSTSVGDSVRIQKQADDYWDHFPSPSATCPPHWHGILRRTTAPLRGQTDHAILSRGVSSAPWPESLPVHGSDSCRHPRSCPVGHTISSPGGTAASHPTLLELNQIPVDTTRTRQRGGFPSPPFPRGRANLALRGSQGLQTVVIRRASCGLDLRVLQRLMHQVTDCPGGRRSRLAVSAGEVIRQVDV